MQKVSIGDKVQFLYNGKMRSGMVESTWQERLKGDGKSYRHSGFCVDHGGYYKSYRKTKTKFMAKASS